MKKVLLFLSCLLILPNFIKASGTEAVIKEVAKEQSSNISLASKAGSAILIEASTGEILFEKNANEKMAPASMTKMMSMLVIIENIEKGVIKWDDVITASENASSMGGSQILLETGEKMTVTDLFKGVAVASGNDAVVALAEAIAGTTDEFVRMMNEKAKELGLKNTNFKNPHGLEEANHYSSAYDMAMIAKELVKHEKVLEFTVIYDDYLRKGTDREFWLVNTNKLVRYYTGVDGLKTGFTNEAGYCLTATAKKNNMRLIAVVMKEESSAVRNAEVTSMLDYGFAQYKIDELVGRNKVVAKVEIDKGEEKYAEIVPINEATILNKKTDNIGEITYDLKLDNIKAPVKVGDKVGILEIKENGKKIREVPITVNKDVKKAGFLNLYWRYLSDIIGGAIKF